MVDYPSIDRRDYPTVFPVRRFFVGVAAGMAWFFAGVAILGLLAFFWLPSPQASPLAITLAFLVLVGLSTYFRRARRQIAITVLGHVSTAVSLGLPIPSYLHAAAVTESGSMRRRLRRLKIMLEQGDSIGLAVSEVLGELPQATLDRIHAAERSATLQQTLPELVRRERHGMNSLSDVHSSLAYSAVLFMMMQFMIGVVLIFVMPKFVEIFRDFGIPMPPMTVALTNAPVVLMTVVCALMIPFLMITLSRVTRGLFISRPLNVGGRWLDAVQWHFPLLGYVVRNSAAADASAVIAESLTAGRPLPDAIASARMAGLNRVLSRRLEAMYSRVVSGEPAGAAASASRLPQLMAAAFAMQGGASDLAGAMGFAARAYASSTQRLMITLRAAFPVVLTLIFGGAVAFIALALFQPIVALINSIPV